MAQFKDISPNASAGAKLTNWFENRFPTAFDAYRVHMSEYYAPKNFNFWYIFGSLALLVLVILAWLMAKTSVKLPVAKVFRVLTWLIYALGFKILGISVHALQLTGLLPLTALNAPWLQSNALGIYPTVETLLAQGLYLAVIVVIQRVIHRNAEKIPTMTKQST